MQSLKHNACKPHLCLCASRLGVCCLKTQLHSSDIESQCSEYSISHKIRGVMMTTPLQP